MAASSWFADGFFLGYDAATAGLAANVMLASNGMVDIPNGAPTRMQYQTPDAFTNNFLGSAKIRVTYEDWFNAHSAGSGGKASNGITAVMCVVPASLLGSNPTVADVYLRARTSGYVVPSTTWATAPSVNSYVDVTFGVVGPASTQLTPNTKYWAAMVPLVYAPGDSLNTAIPLFTARNTTHLLGRGVSLWSNRTPNAPVITSPVTNSIVASGALLDLTIAGSDPDVAFGGTSPQYTDIAGVHVQYAPRPVAGGPSPTWIDLPFANASGVLYNQGWWIKDSNANIPGGGGPAGLATNSTVKMRVGSNTPTANAGLLPSGSWQVRVRTFDFGHPYPNNYPPLAGYTSGGAFSPNNYPATNTSGWSAPVIVTVSAQVPAPIPTSPVNGAGVPDSVSVVLTWQYRNTAVPPFPQAQRSLQIRRVGTTAWTTLVANQASADTSYTVSGFSFVSGNQYEWQVQVRDSDGVQSAWSDIARFWVVPTGSGGTPTDPAETIDGATLGCGNNRVFVYRRGGVERVAELRGLESVEWNRIRDDISTAEVTITGWDEDCGNLLAQLQPWAYELVIFRENGYTSDRVWEGPITLLTYEHDRVTIDAKDVLAYAYRRIIRQQMDDSKNGDSVVSRAARVLQNAFAPDDPNVLSYLTILAREDDAKQYRSTPAYARTAFEEIDDMAANAGLDYTAFGRAIMLWGTKHRIGTLPEFQNKDLGSPPIVSVYGMSTSNVYVVSDGNGLYGEATRLDEYGQDNTFGLIEMLSSSWASDSEPEEGTLTQDGLTKIRESFAESAERSIASRFPPPVVVRVPDNTTINPDTVVSIQNLLPGVVVPLRSTGTLRTVIANQKMDALKVIQKAGEETITFTLSPFSRDDVESLEGE